MTAIATIATITKNSCEQLRIELSEYKGRQLVSCRIWYEHDGGEMRPSREGFALAVEKLPELVEAVRQAEMAAQEQGLLTPVANTSASKRRAS